MIVLSGAQDVGRAAEEHMASTATLFMTFRHGSPPKMFWEMATMHFSFPMHICSDRTRIQISLLIQKEKRKGIMHPFDYTCKNVK